MISEEQVRHIAKLARLGLSDSEVGKFSKQLSAIFDFVKILEKVDTSKVQPTSQVTGLKNVMRKDEVKAFADREGLLACSELPLEDDQIKVQAAITH